MGDIIHGNLKRPSSTNTFNSASLEQNNSLLERTQSKPYCCWLPNFTIPIIVSAISFQPDAMAHEHPNPKDYFSIYFGTQRITCFGTNLSRSQNSGPFPSFFSIMPFFNVGSTHRCRCCDWVYKILM